MTMADQQSSLGTGACESQAINGVVQSPLQELQQGFSSDPSLALGALEVVAKLFLEQAEYPFHLLLFSELQPVTLDSRSTALSVLTGGEVALLDGTLVGKTTFAFEEELHAFPPPEPPAERQKACPCGSP